LPAEATSASYFVNLPAYVANVVRLESLGAAWQAAGAPVAGQAVTLLGKTGTAAGLSELGPGGRLS
jgi:hypothetical protein